MRGKISEHKRKGLHPAFAEVHLKEEGDNLHVEATLNTQVRPENTAASIYIDGSFSMENSRNFGPRGMMRELGLAHNPVESAMDFLGPLIIDLDATKSVRVGYGMTGEGGRFVQILGEMEDPDDFEFTGPEEFGKGTRLVPIMRDFAQYISGLVGGGELVETALAVVITDGVFHDSDEAIEVFHDEFARRIQDGEFPNTLFSLVGVGPQIDERQLNHIMHESKPDWYEGRELVCYSIAKTMADLSQVISHLVSKHTPAIYGGGVLLDENGNELEIFESYIPAVIEFKLPGDATSFTIRAVGGEDIVQPLADIPAGHSEEEEEDEDHDEPRH